jgi:hypothetical protein
MTYGIEILNKEGGTVFNSTNYVELGIHTGTVNSYVSGGSGMKFDIPDYCFGFDQMVVTGTFSAQRFTSFDWASSGWPDSAIALYITNMPGQLSTLQSINYGASDNVSNIIGFDATTYDDGTGAYYKIIQTSQDMTGIRNTAGSSTLSTMEWKRYEPSIYIRPTSSSYSGKFWAIMRNHTSYVGLPTSDYDQADALNVYLEIHDSVSGSNQFEVMIAQPADVWGGVSGTKAHTAGTSTYGLHSRTEGGQKHTPSGDDVQFTTFDSRGRPSKILLTRKAGLPFEQVTNLALGSLATSNTKRWCRMNGTSLYLHDHTNGFGSSSTYWHWLYKWDSNSSISVQLNNDTGQDYYATLPIYPFQDTLTSQQFFAVADFGLGL